MRNYQFSFWFMLAFSFALMGPLDAQVIISEYMEGSSNNKALELYNAGSDSVDLAEQNYRIEMFFNGKSEVGRTILLSGVLEAGQVLVIAHSQANADILGKADLTLGGGFFNGDDALVLRNDLMILDSLGQIGEDPGSAWSQGGVSTKDMTLRRLALSDGDEDPFDTFSPANAWGAFPRDDASNLGSVGGTGGGDPQEPEEYRIYEIQGAGHRSPLLGELANVPGLVTAVSDKGFYFQDPEGDGDPATSDGIYVYLGERPDLNVGDAVLVTGRVREFLGGGDAVNLTLTQLSEATYSPAPALFPGLEILPTPLNPPNLIIEDDGFGLFEPTSDGVDYFESLEGMLVRLAEPVVTGPTNHYGELWVLTDGGRNASGRNARGGISLTPGAVVDFNPERIQLDDGLFPVTMPAFSVGDSLTDVSGVVSYSFGNYEVLPATAPALVAGGLIPTVVPENKNTRVLSVASFNVENLDPKVEEGLSARNTDDDVGEGKFSRLAEQVVVNLRSPDIIALQEIQDNDGAENNGVTSASETYALLIQEIQKAGGPAYRFFDVAPLDGADGGQPGGNIRVGFLYNPARVSPAESRDGAGDAVTDIELLGSASELRLSHNPGRINPRDSAWDSSRKSLAAQFVFRGKDIFIVNNHFASKGGSTSLFGAVQPSVNGNEEKRTRQAKIVRDFVREILSKSSEARVVVLGDLNEFAFFPPLLALKGEGDEQLLFDLGEEKISPEERYSYVYQGNSQALDHIFVNKNLLERADLFMVHANAEFPDHATDHDPLLLRLNFQAAQMSWLETLFHWFWSCLGF